MRQTSCKILLLILPALLFIQTYVHAGNIETYHEANIAYQQKEYEKAIELYQSLIKQGHLAPELYYNLANAFYKHGNIPDAILNYERSLKMNPKDEDSQFNLKIASLQVVDKIDPVPQIFYKRWIDSLTQLFSSSDWASIMIALLWISLITACLYLFGGSVRIRKIGFLLSISFLVVFLLSYIMASKSHSAAYFEQSAIVMSPSVYVKSSPDPKGNDLFIIHEGTKVELLDELNEWKKIKLQNGSIGWLMNTEIEKI